MEHEQIRLAIYRGGKGLHTYLRRQYIIARCAEQTLELSAVELATSGRLAWCVCDVIKLVVDVVQ